MNIIIFLKFLFGVFNRTLSIYVTSFSSISYRRNSEIVLKWVAKLPNIILPFSVHKYAHNLYFMFGRALFRFYKIQQFFFFFFQNTTIWCLFLATRGRFHEVGCTVQSAAPNFWEAFCSVKVRRRCRAQMDRAISMKNAQL